MLKKYLDIDNCIIIHNMKQIKKTPVFQKKIKSKRQLAKKIHNNQDMKETYWCIYMKISRAEKTGVKPEDKELIAAILKNLEVNEKELIKEI